MTELYKLRGDLFGALLNNKDFLEVSFKDAKYPSGDSGYKVTFTSKDSGYFVSFNFGGSYSKTIDESLKSDAEAVWDILEELRKEAFKELM